MKIDPNGKIPPSKLSENGSINLCVHVCMYVHVYTCMYVRMYVCMYMYV